MTPSEDPCRVLPARAGAQSPWILLVEDEPALLRILCDALVRHGYRVSPCVTGQAALDALDRADVPPALVIADVLLPDTDGGHVVAAARTRNPAVRVILTSGFGEEDVASFEVSADAFLSKPFSLNELLARVRSMI